MKKLWQKDSTNSSAKIVDDYCFGESGVLDNELVKYDVQGSIAHAQALNKLGIISKEETEKLTQALKGIIKLAEAGKFVVGPADEDVHTKVENYLTEKWGELGKKIHTARSRNDQVLVDLRLYSKDQLLVMANTIKYLIESFVNWAKKYEFVPMPGYTHMQKAMPSSIGMWAGSFVESLLDDLKLVKTAYELNDQSPLGTGAAYGLSLPVDRELTAKLLGFAKVQNNSLYTQSSRLKIQLAIMQSLMQIMLTLSRFASDLLLFTASEFNFFTVDPQLCTGSSIMPQKKNLDVMEYLRAKTHTVIGYQQIISSIAAGLPSGYNADFGETKGPFMKTFNIVNQSLKVVALVAESLKPNVDQLEKAMTPDLFATYAAYELVKKGMPFRDAYVKIGKSLDKLPEYNVVEVLKQSTHVGGTGNLRLGNIIRESTNIIKNFKKIT